jgi:thiamine biosynthesis protein ThiS
LVEGLADVNPSDAQTITVNGRTVSWEEGMTVQRVLEVMNYTFRMLVVKVDDRLVKRENYTSFPIPAGADVKVIHMVAGG